MCICVPTLGNRRKVEEKVLTFRAENSTLEKKLRETMDGFQNLKDDLSLCTQERDQLAQEKRQLEVKKIHSLSLSHIKMSSEVSNKHNVHVLLLLYLL